MSLSNPIIRIVHVSKYYPGQKGLMIELVTDREESHPNYRGQFRLSPYSDTEGFYTLKAAAQEAKWLADHYHVDLSQYDEEGNKIA